MADGTWDDTFDLIVVGSGAGALVAAIRAAERGAKVLVLEREPSWGGTSAWSGGGMWMPNNPLMQRDGAGDSTERALQYMDAVIGDVGPASSPERRRAYAETCPQVVAFLEEQGVPFIRAELYPDYYPEQPGGMVGRGIEAEVLDGKTLGPWLGTLSAPDNMPSVAMTTRDVHYLPKAMRTWAGFSGTVRVLARTAWWMLTGRRPLGIGQALLGRLMLLIQEHKVPVWLSSPMRSLVEEDGRVVGVIAEREGREVRLKARAGVMLAAGGFAKNGQMRQKHQPVGSQWTSVAPGDQGEAILAGGALQAATALMDDAWWGASMLHPDGTASFSVHERSFPGCIIVDDTGERFVNESASYIDVGHAMLERSRDGVLPSFWLILDASHRRRYLFGQTPPGITPRDWIDSGFFIRAPSVAALAEKTGIDAAGLAQTIERFNGFARSGKDQDFQRGDSVYDNYYGDPTCRPNPNLAPIENAPFGAVRLVVGDLGTKGGLLTDELARVLRTDGSVIEGLYASGNTTASVMGRTYPGPGSTLGPAVTFAYIGAQHALNHLDGAGS